jgi:membrane-associated phospholipid phosphatase
MSALRRTLLAVGALVGAYIVCTVVVAAGLLKAYDTNVAAFAGAMWSESLKPIFYGIAELGGIELTTVLAAGLGLYLWRAGFGIDALALLAFPVSVALEVVYKRLVYHPGPGLSISHGDGPSFFSGIGEALAMNSFPSGHVVRTVVVWGLLGFVVHRLATRAWLRRLAIPVAVLVVILMVIDRLYLGVHWESDVIGGLLLGGICLAGAIIWLDRPVGEGA